MNFKKLDFSTYGLIIPVLVIAVPIIRGVTGFMTGEFQFGGLDPQTPPWLQFIDNIALPFLILSSVVGITFSLIGIFKGNRRLGILAIIINLLLLAGLIFIF